MKTSFFKCCIPLLYRPAIMEYFFIVPRTDLGNLQINKTTAVLRRPFDQLKIIRRKKHRTEHSHKLSFFRGRFINQNFFAFVPGQFNFDFMRYTANAKIQKNCSFFFIEANQFFIIACTERLSHRGEINRLNDIRFSCTVFSCKDSHVSDKLNRKIFKISYFNKMGLSASHFFASIIL